MRVPWRRDLGLLALLAMTLGNASGTHAEEGPAESIPSADLVQPATLVAEMRQTSAPRPLILQVGFRMLFEEAHIPSAVYAGPGNSGSGLQTLRTRLVGVPKHKPIVIYCGCCPWSHCPNVAAAYGEMHRLGFDHVRVLYIAENFGHDWIEPGYPIQKGT